MKLYNEFLNEVLTNSSFSTTDTDNIAVYNDLSPESRNELDKYCNDNFSKQFLECSFDEQSTARSVLWSEKNKPDEISKQKEINAKI